MFSRCPSQRWAGASLIYPGADVPCVLEDYTPCMTDRLNSGESIQVNESLGSPDGQFSLVLQEDGNLVLYGQDGQPVWASGTDGLDVARATLQEDGNLVLYSSGGDAVWASN